MKLILTGLALALAGASTVAAQQNYQPNYGPAPMTDPHAGTQKKPAAQAQQAQPAQSPEAAIKPSPKATKAIIDLQTAVNAKDTANIPAKLAAAQAVATTKEDHYWIARMQLKAAVDSNDNAGAGTAIDAIAATGLMSKTDLASLYSGLGGTAFNAKQYDAAAAAFQHQIALDPTDTTAIVNLAQSRVAGGHKAEGLAALQQAIQASNAGGKKVSEDVYKQAVGIAYEGNMPNAYDLSRQWLAAYPNPDSWRNTIAIYRNQSHQDGEGTLDLLRLMQAANAIQKPTDYALYVNAALDQQNFNEAKAALDAGIAAHVVDPASADFHGMVAELKAKKMPTKADLEAAMKMSPSGFNQLRIGDRFYAMGEYARAAEIYKATLGKSGVDPDVANLHLGIALARAGDKAGAAAAFKSVTGARADIAKLWLIYVQ